MPTGPNTLRWDGGPGHYEVYYLSATDRASGVGFWIRYTMRAPTADTGEPGTASLWFMAMDPRTDGPGRVIGRKHDVPVGELRAEAEPFRLTIGDAELTDTRMRGAFEDVRWDLTWSPSRPYAHVHPLLERARIAKTVLVLPHADLEVRGVLAWDGRTLDLTDCRGGQAHLWGSRHAERWAWLHANDLETLAGERRPGDFLDGVSVFVPRLGREMGPNTPFVGRLGGTDLRSISPLRVLANRSDFAPTGWEFEVVDGRRKVVGTVSARHEDLAGVTYHDPDGREAYCYNTEVASLRATLWERTGRGSAGWHLVETRQAPGRAHFEYAQRETLPDLPLHVR